LREATIHSQLGHLQVSREGYAGVGRRDPFAYLIEEPGRWSQRLGALGEVRDVMMRLDFAGLASNGRSERPVIAQGVEPEKEARLGSFVTIVAGRQLADADAYGALVGEGVAKALRLAPGDPLTLVANTPEGALNTLDLELVGVFRSFSREYDDRAVRVPLAAAQELLATGGVHTLVFNLARTEATDAVAEQARALLAEQGFEVQPWYTLADFYRKSVDLYRRQFAVLQVIILAMVVLGVANSINLAIHERTGEFGTLMALGRRPRDVFRLVLAESVLLGALGAAGGVLLGVLAAWGVSRLGIPMPPLPNSDIGYTARILVVPGVVGTAFAVGLLATTLASVIPARRAARLPVVEALRANV
jgi:putative ABC transport system permease protein